MYIMPGAGRCTVCPLNIKNDAAIRLAAQESLPDAPTSDLASAWCQCGLSDLLAQAGPGKRSGGPGDLLPIFGQK